MLFEGGLTVSGEYVVSLPVVGDKGPVVGRKENVPYGRPASYSIVAEEGAANVGFVCGRVFPEVEGGRRKSTDWVCVFDASLEDAEVDVFF